MTSTTVLTGGYRQWLTAHNLIPCGVFLYLLFARTRGITETFVLLGDQILYWTMALGPASDLPLAGPSSVGGTTLGPSFVWTMWGIGQIVGPWFDNAPHAGGIGVALLQSAADAFLLVALWRNSGSIALALATTLLMATGPLDLALSATIWNPPIAVAFVKVAIALVLLEPRGGSIWWGLSAAAAAVLAVQAHSSAVFVAAPVIASFSVRDILARQWVTALARGRATIELVLVLQFPYLLNLILNRPDRVWPTMVIEGVAGSVSGSAGFRFRESFEALTSSTQSILLSPWSLPGFGGLLVAALGVTAFRLRRDLPLLAATAAPVVLAVLGLATWQRPFDTYWYLTVAPSVSLVLALAMTVWRRGAARVAVAMVAALVAAQPARLAESMRSHRLPEYGALLRGTQEIRRRMPEVRDIETSFSLPPSADRTFIYKTLGGRITPEAGFVARVDAAGDVTFRPAAP